MVRAHALNMKLYICCKFCINKCSMCVCVDCLTLCMSPATCNPKYTRHLTCMPLPLTLGGCPPVLIILYVRFCSWYVLLLTV